MLNDQTNSTKECTFLSKILDLGYTFFSLWQALLPQITSLKMTGLLKNRSVNCRINQRLCDVLTASNVSPDVLQWVSLPLVNRTSCEQHFDSLGIKPKVTDHEICAGYLHTSSGISKGDAGGPLVCELKGQCYSVSNRIFGVIFLTVKCSCVLFCYIPIVAQLTHFFSIRPNPAQQINIVVLDFQRNLKNLLRRLLCLQ